MNSKTLKNDWRQAWHSFLLEWGPIANFVFKTATAALLALWIAFRIGLPTPYSAMITVVIVAQPYSGMVLEKSLYRLLGTLVGSLVTLLMVSLFAQQRELFLAAMALWIGICTIGATWFRNFQSYAFVLSGYTAVLIGFSAVLRPEDAIGIAIDRVSVVSLGILCAAFVSDGLFVHRLSAQLVALVRRRSITLYQTVEDALLRPATHEQANQRQLELMTSVFQFETSRSAAVMENPETRARSARLQRLNAQFMAVTSSLHGLERKLQRLGNQREQDTIAALQPLAQRLCAVLRIEGQFPRTAVQATLILPRLRQLRSQLPKQIALIRETLHTTTDGDHALHFNDAARILQQMLSELIGYTGTWAALRHTREVDARPAPRYRPSVDPQLALLNGLRAAAATALVSVFWIVTAWPSAIFAIVNTAVFSALFSASPSPRTALRGVLRGFGFGFVAASVCGLWVLPQVSGFPLLAVGLLPFLLPGLVWLTRPQTAGMGIGYLIMLVVSVAPTNVMHYDAAALVNNGLAQMLGVAAAVFAFSILVPDHYLRGHARVRQRLRGELRRLCSSPLRGLRHHFDSATRDLLQQQRQPPDPALVAATLACLELGHGLLCLRRAMTSAQRSASARVAGQAALKAIETLLESPLQLQRQHALDELEISLAKLRNHRPTDPAAQATQERLRQILQRLTDLLRDDDTLLTLFPAQPQHLPRDASHAT